MGVWSPFIVTDPELAPRRRGRPHAAAGPQLVMLALAAALVTACTAEDAREDEHRPPAAVVTRPGEILFVRAERRSVLAKLPADVLGSWCLVADNGQAPPSLPPVRQLRALEEGPDNASEPFAWTVMTEGAATLAGDPAARSALLALLDRWAQGAGLTQLEKGTANSYYALDRTLLPTLVSFSLVRDDPALDALRRDRIERWLGQVARLRGPDRRLPGPREATARNNHYYLRASVSMAWGALTGDDRAFREGIGAYRQALADMRPDGSLPLETARGARAVWYQRHAIASLVTIAEMAATQGIDLYGEAAAGGRTIHKAVGFLLDAAQDPRRVWPYARAGGKPGGDVDYRDQDLDFLVRRGHGRHYMAWAEMYLARFPYRAESRRLLGLLARADPSFRPMIDDYSGGDATCFFARPEAAVLGGA
jgi:poly(beta-D-mannuronate) lyase